MADNSDSISMALSKRSRTKVYSGKSIGMKCMCNVYYKNVIVYVCMYIRAHLYLFVFIIKMFQVFLICA